jgi:hypothetical protein
MVFGILGSDKATLAVTVFQGAWYGDTSTGHFPTRQDLNLSSALFPSRTLQHIFRLPDTQADIATVKRAAIANAQTFIHLS